MPPIRRGEIWFAATPGGDRPVLILTRDPVADRIGSDVVATLTRAVRGLESELPLTKADGVPSGLVDARSLRRHHDTMEVRGSIPRTPTHEPDYRVCRAILAPPSDRLAPRGWVLGQER